MREALPLPVAQCLHVLRAHGFPAYPVGGCVRDVLLGRVPGDWDICTAALPEVVGGLFDKTVPTGIRHGTVTVLLGGMSLEVTTFRADGAYTDSRHPDAVTFGVSLQEDLARRDFTVNAMALGPEGVIDPFGGQADLARKLIRAVGDPAKRFSEDALRMFRAVRFSAQLDFEIEDATLRAIPPLAHLSRQISGERVKIEVEKTLLSPAPEQASLFLELGLLKTPRQGDLAALATLPATPEARWRGFCVQTGFDITSLPVQRRLRTAVLHPEREIIPTLALSGGDLQGLGLRGPAISRAQTVLALHVLDHPEDNTAEKLLALLKSQDLLG